MMDDVTFLTKLRDLLSDPTRWTQGTAVEIDVAGRSRYCWVGACGKVHSTARSSVQAQLEQTVRVFKTVVASYESGVPEGIDPTLAAMTRINDRLGHAMVMDMIEQALILARSARSVADLKRLAAEADALPREAVPEWAMP